MGFVAPWSEEGGAAGGDVAGCGWRISFAGGLGALGAFQSDELDAVLWLLVSTVLLRKPCRALCGTG